jgi:excisionase family DNA binding protein
MMPHRPTPPPLLTPREAADYLKVSEKTLEDWRRTGKGPAFYRLGPCRVRYSLASVDQWLQSTSVSKQEGL